MIVYLAGGVSGNLKPDAVLDTPFFYILTRERK